MMEVLTKWKMSAGKGNIHRAGTCLFIILQMSPFQDKFSLSPQPPQAVQAFSIMLPTDCEFTSTRASPGHINIPLCSTLYFLGWMNIMPLMKISGVPSCTQPYSECKEFEQEQDTGPALEEFTRVTNLK